MIVLVEITASSDSLVFFALISRKILGLSAMFFANQKSQ